MAHQQGLLNKKYMRTVYSLLLLLVMLPGISSATISYRVVATLPYPGNIFTQGAQIEGDKLFVSGGKFGESALFEFQLPQMTLQRSRLLSPNLFAEGLALTPDNILVLTWKARRLLQFDRQMQLQATLPYKGEGWGLAYNAESRQLVMSNGSNQLVFRRWPDWKKVRTLTLFHRRQPLINLNELEWIGNIILANVWQTDTIYAICAASGQLLDSLSLSRLASAHRNQGVLNGMAWWSRRQLLWVSGKYWDKAYLLKINLAQLQRQCYTMTPRSHSTGSN